MNEPKAKFRATHLLLTEVAILDSWADRLRALPAKREDLIGVYLVGSALVTKNYRDVDVSVVLRDKAVKKLRALVNAKSLDLALSHEGQRVTGLPIDCQIQSLTESGAEAGADGAPTPRPLGTRVRPMQGKTQR